jgi:PIN domain nuclease of toxin-antitoxin system
MQRYLIDTNIFIFYVVGNDFIDRDVRQIIEDYENTIYICSESVKEAIHLWKFFQFSIPNFQFFPIFVP